MAAVAPSAPVRRPTLHPPSTTCRPPVPSRVRVADERVKAPARPECRALFPVVISLRECTVAPSMNADMDAYHLMYQYQLV